MALREYRRKRDFSRTSEPRGKLSTPTGRSYVFQKHAASRLHYDFRLEHEGVLLSWAVPKGPSLDPADKRLAVQVEDHPTSYGGFEGVIPRGEYGAGSVLLWDRGTWKPAGDVAEGMRKGKLEFELFGKKLRGKWKLIRMRGRNGDAGKNWLFIKSRDEAARRGGRSIVDAQPESVKSGRRIDEIGSPVRARKSPGKLSKTVSARASTAARVVRKRSAHRTPRPPRRAAPSRPAGARRAVLEGFQPLQLATRVDAPPDTDGWIHEVKYDGYRMLAELDRGKVRWFSRNGRDWTRRFAALSTPITELGAKQALLDGEVVALDEHGASQFQRLQRALSEKDSHDLVYYAFDLLHLDGWDLRGCKLLDRKRALQTLIGRVGVHSTLRYSDHVDHGGAPFLAAACEHDLEGIISKRADGRYLAGRSREWTKAKCGERQEFVVVGYTKPKGSRAGLGALVLAVHEGGGLRFSGRVGTGFDARTLSALERKLKPTRVDVPAFDEPLSPESRRGVQWVEPRMVVEVAFTGWTSEGLLRHPTFRGVREDKSAAEVVRERQASVSRVLDSARPASRSVAPRMASAARRSGVKPSRRAIVKASLPDAPASSAAEVGAGKARVAGVEISHPDRVLDPEGTVTKLDVARYYERAAPLLLPHIVDRPLSVLRCPDGFGRPCFFQKHAGGMFPKSVKSIKLRDSGGMSQYLHIDSLEGLIALAQMNVVELHPWGSLRDQLEKPDRMCFDLDPALDVAWERVVAAALHVRDVLAGLDIESFVKTTGGKGLHVVVPLARRYGWAEIKGFSRAIAFEMARVEPDEYVAVATRSARKGRIFIDYLRNSRGATAVAPYSLRARPGASISMPISWKTLEKLESGADFFVEHDVAWKKPAGRDPWATFASSPQTLPGAALKRTGKSRTRR